MFMVILAAGRLLLSGESALAMRTSRVCLGQVFLLVLVTSTKTWPTCSTSWTMQQQNSTTCPECSTTTARNSLSQPINHKTLLSCLNTFCSASQRTVKRTTAWEGDIYKIEYCEYTVRLLKKFVCSLRRAFLIWFNLQVRELCVSMVLSILFSFCHLLPNTFPEIMRCNMCCIT